MNNASIAVRLAVFAALVAAMPVLAQTDGARKGPPTGAAKDHAGAGPRGGGPETRTAAPTPKDGATIQWFGTLERGLAEAQRTGKPILLVSGAPHCSGVPGMWCPGKVKIDNGWLLHDDVIAASKAFVCIRLTSYESESEAAFVSKLEGNPVNTVFAILTPDGTPAIKVQGRGRGPGELFDDTADMVKQLGEVAGKYPGRAAKGTPALPITLDARLGLAVASADLQPLVLLLEPDAAARSALESKVAALAWSPEFRGRFAYASAASTAGLKLTGGTGLKSGVLLVEPDIFGVRGAVVKEVPPGDLDTRLADAMRGTLASHVRASKSREQLRRMALQQGVFFETGIPVTGKKEAEDRAKYKKQLEAAGRATAGG